MYMARGDEVENSRVQIITPVYNSEKYLKRCLDSLKKQTYENFEVLLIDDCSTDNSEKIIREYSECDKRFVYIKLDKNSGAAAARNKGLELLGCDYTAFLDSDDYWEPDMLEVMLSKAKEHNCQVVQCRYMYDYPGGKTFVPKGAFSGDVFLEKNRLRPVFIKMMTGINMNHVCMKLIKTELIHGIAFDKDLKTAEDLKFCVDLFKRVDSYCFTDRVLYHYCRNETSLTGGGMSFKEKLAANRAVSRHMVNALPDYGLNNIFYRTLSRMRPYIIILSKIWRTLIEKIKKT